MRFLLAVLILLHATVAHARQAPDMERLIVARAEDVIASLQGTVPVFDTFSDSFVAAVPPPRLAQITSDIVRTSGSVLAAQSIEVTGPYGGRFTIRFEHATASARIQLSQRSPYKVDFFNIDSIAPTGDSEASIVADFAALPGTSGFAVARLDPAGPVIETGYNQDHSLAVASTFKLWVLDALAEEIRAGRLHWDNVTLLGPPSLPSGIAQDWPQDTPVTLQSLATLMISISDNTATDALIRAVGRERIEARVRAIGMAEPGGLIPLLTTAEAFALKRGGAAAVAAWLEADEAGRRLILRSAAARLDSPVTVPPPDATQPRAIDTIEWFASPRDVARVLDSLRRRDDPRLRQILGIANHVPREIGERFAWIGYKGGSEAGVIALNWLVRTRSGQWYAVSAVWNDPAEPLENTRFEFLGQRLLRMIEP